MEILFVCTGNICRSPMAEALLRRRLGAPGPGEAAELPTVRSVGTMGAGGPASPGAVAAMAEFGIDLEGHRSRPLTGGDVARADLVIGMAREHVREVCVLDPGAWDRAFTLKELVRRASAAGPRPHGVDLAGWLAGVGAGRSLGDLLGDDPADDVGDPIGLALKAYRACAAELAYLIDVLVALA